MAVDQMDLRRWTPEDPEVFSVFIQLYLGPKTWSSGPHARAKRTDLFTIRVASPGGLEQLDAEGEILAWGRIIVMRRYDRDDLIHALERIVASCEAESWSGCVDLLRRHFNWEFER